MSILDKKPWHMAKARQPPPLWVGSHHYCKGKRGLAKNMILKCLWYIHLSWVHLNQYVPVLDHIFIRQGPTVLFFPFFFWDRRPTKPMPNALRKSDQLHIDIFRVFLSLLIRGIFLDSSRTISNNFPKVLKLNKLICNRFITLSLSVHWDCNLLPTMQETRLIHDNMLIK